MHSWSPTHRRRSRRLQSDSVGFIRLELSGDDDEDDRETVHDANANANSDGEELQDVTAEAATATPMDATGEASASSAVLQTHAQLPLTDNNGSFIWVLSDREKMELVKANQADKQAGICLYCHEAPDPSVCTDSPVPRAIPWSNWALADSQVFGTLCDCNPLLVPRHLICCQREIELMSPVDSRACKLCGGHKRAFAYRDPADAPGNVDKFPIRLMVFQSSLSAAVAALYGLEKQYSMIADPCDFEQDLAEAWTTAWHGFKAGLFAVYCAPPGIRWVCQNPPPDVYACVHVVVTLYGNVIHQSAVLQADFVLTDKLKRKLQSPKNAAWLTLRAPGLEGMSYEPWDSVVRLRQRLIDLSYPRT